MVSLVLGTGKLFQTVSFKLDPRAKKVRKDQLLAACLEEFLAVSGPVTPTSKSISDGLTTFKFVQSWTCRDGDVFTEYIKHPVDSDSYSGLAFLYLWFPKKEEGPATGQLVAFSSQRLHGESLLFPAPYPRK